MRARPTTTTTNIMIYGKILENYMKNMGNIRQRWAHNGPFELLSRQAWGTGAPFVAALYVIFFGYLRIGDTIQRRESMLWGISQVSQ